LLPSMSWRSVSANDIMRMTYTPSMMRS
jgi:hypothetical protein